MSPYIWRAGTDLPPNSNVQVPKTKFERLNRSKVSLFTQELCQLVFGRDVLRKSNLTGKSPEGKPPKSQLDPKLVEAVIGKFTEPNTPNVSHL